MSLKSLNIQMHNKDLSSNKFYDNCTIHRLDL